jgi:hypothetical protein
MFLFLHTKIGDLEYMVSFFGGEGREDRVSLL